MILHVPSKPGELRRDRSVRITPVATKLFATEVRAFYEASSAGCGALPRRVREMVGFFWVVLNDLDPAYLQHSEVTRAA